MASKEAIEETVAAPVAHSSEVRSLAAASSSTHRQTQQQCLVALKRKEESKKAQLKHSLSGKRGYAPAGTRARRKFSTVLLLFPEFFIGQSREQGGSKQLSKMIILAWRMAVLWRFEAAVTE